MLGCCLLGIGGTLRVDFFSPTKFQVQIQVHLETRRGKRQDRFCDSVLGRYIYMKGGNKRYRVNAWLDIRGKTILGFSFNIVSYGRIWPIRPLSQRSPISANYGRSWASNNLDNPRWTVRFNVQPCGEKPGERAWNVLPQLSRTDRTRDKARDKFLYSC